MTPISKALAAALLAAPLALPGVASAQTTTVAPEAQADAASARAVMLERLKIRSAVTDSVIDYYESDRVVEDDEAADPMQGDGWPTLVSGQPVAEGINLKPIPEDLAQMLPSVEGAEWMRTGDHLVAVQDGVAQVVVWDVLP